MEDSHHYQETGEQPFVVCGERAFIFFFFQRTIGVERRKGRGFKKEV
jgi:hypothetical protein